MVDVTPIADGHPDPRSERDQQPKPKLRKVIDKNTLPETTNTHLGRGQARLPIGAALELRFVGHVYVRVGQNHYTHTMSQPLQTLVVPQ